MQRWLSRCSDSESLVKKRRRVVKSRLSSQGNKSGGGRAEYTAALRLCIVCTRATQLLFVLRLWNVSYNNVNVPVNQNAAVGRNNSLEFNR